MRFLRQIQSLLLNEADPLERVRKLIDGSKNALWPVVYFLAEWSCWRLGEQQRKGGISLTIKGVKKSSVYRYLSSIGRHLIVIAGSEDLLEMEVEDWESLFEMAAERVKGATERSRYWQSVKSFSAYMGFYGAPDIALTELDGYIGATEAAVNANLVGEKEFRQFKSALLGHDSSSEGEDTVADSSPDLDSPKTQVFLAAMLGYRCGLRRREVQMLWVHDIYPGARAVLQVRASNLATLKSRSAYRRIPLDATLPADELKLLLDFRERKLAQLEGRQALLLSHSDSPQVPLSDQLLFLPITQAFQRICGNGGPTFRFHHLRHSFSNWLLLALLLADNSNLWDEADPIIQAGPLDRVRIATIKQSLFPRLLGTPPAPTRKNLYLVSSLLGHLSPDTSLRHYIHLMDWLVGKELDVALNAELSGISAKELAAICGISESMPYKAPYGTLIKDPVRFLRQFVRQNCPAILREVPLASTSAADLSDIVEKIGSSPPPGPARMMLMLGRLLQQAPKDGWQRGDSFLDAFREKAMGKLERDHSVSRTTLIALLTNYLKLYAKQTVGTAKQDLEMPTPPRTREDALEFWRILDASCASFDSVAARESMDLAAGFWIQRNGPRELNLYFGKQWRLASNVVDGIIAMGMQPTLLTLQYRRDDAETQQAKKMMAIAREIEGKGVALSDVDLDWTRRSSAGAVMRLVISNQKLDVPDSKLQRKVGRVRGMNYAALWIKFASSVVG